jgi:protocatechuate 3,4-dioxygenase beta subunit
MLVGVGALLTKRKLKCQTCGEYNDTGNAQPFKGPEARKWRKAWEKEQDRKSAAQRATEQRSAELAAAALLSQVAQMQAQGVVIDDNGEPVSEAPAIAPLSGWHPDPRGRHQYRCWNGQTWSAEVADNGARTTDPLG